MGATGATGPAGDKGDKGDKGDTGDTGDTGAASTVAGPAGPAGTPGATGPQGPAGPSGTTGSTVVVGTAVTANNGSATATCAAGKIAVGGGGSISAGSLMVSAPALNGTVATTSGQVPNSWKITWSGNNSGTAYVVCAN
jgi:hypothetical protein